MKQVSHAARPNRHAQHRAPARLHGLVVEGAAAAVQQEHAVPAKSKRTGGVLRVCVLGGVHGVMVRTGFVCVGFRAWVMWQG